MDGVGKELVLVLGRVCWEELVERNRQIQADISVLAGVSEQPIAVDQRSKRLQD